MYRKLSVTMLFTLAGSLAIGQSQPVRTAPASQPGAAHPAARATSATTSKATRGKKPSAAKKTAEPPVEPVQPTPQQPAVPLRPEQLPSVPPKVSYNQGELTVVAENSTMAEIIAAIRNATGVKIEAQGGAGGDRVAARIGPAPVRDVLVSLLDGSHFDYIILGSATDPAAVDRVILSQKTGGAANPAAMANAQAARSIQQQVPPDNSGDGDDDNSEGFTEPAPVPAQQAPNQPQEQQNQQPQQPPDQPNGTAQQQPGQQQNQQPQDQQNQQNVKTPEQLMEELRQMEQNRRNNQNQNQDLSARPERPDVPK